MRRVLSAFLLSIAMPTFAQTENDLIRWVEQNKPLAESGSISLLEFYREMHRRIAIIPGETYPHKVTNLRWIGRKVDILEAVEAGTLTREQAVRRLAEADADLEAADADARRARDRANVERAEAQRQRQEQAAAQIEAQRRALILQMLQNQQPYRPYQHTPYQMPTPRQTNCTSMWNGAAWQTVCQ